MTSAVRRISLSELGAELSASKSYSLPRERFSTTMWRSLQTQPFFRTPRQFSFFLYACALLNSQLLFFRKKDLFDTLQTIFKDDLPALDLILTAPPEVFDSIERRVSDWLY